MYIFIIASYVLQMAGARSTPRNYMLGSSGVMRWSSTQSFGKKARYKFTSKGKKATAKPAPKKRFITKQIGGEKNGGTRVVPAFRSVSLFMIEIHILIRQGYYTMNLLAHIAAQVL